MDVIFKPTTYSMKQTRKAFSSECYNSDLKMVSWSRYSLNYTWIINNASFYNCSSETSIFSSIFSDYIGVNWRLKIDLSEVKDISIYLRLKSNDKGIRAKYNITILNVDKEKHLTENSGVCCFENDICFAYPKFARKDLFNEANGYLENDSLQIVCKISYVMDGERNVQFDVPKNCLSDDVANLLRMAEHSDITLAVGDHEFKAHKAILAARSDVFATMFEQQNKQCLGDQLKENRVHRINITDINYETVSEMLHFIYTDDSPRLRKMVKSLLEAADKFNLKKLKIMCEEEFCRSVSFNSALQLLLIADRHSAFNMKKYIIDYIIIHAKKYFKTESWREMTETHADLTFEVYEAFAISSRKDQRVINEEEQEKNAKILIE